MRLRGFLIAASLWLAVSAIAETAGFCEGERERARTNAERIEREWPLRGSGEGISRYTQSLVERLASQPRRHHIAWRVAVVRNRAPNAFAAGGGYLYLTDGALAFSQTESELAAILAHEMGHQISGHFCPRERPGFFRWLFGRSDDTAETSRHDVREKDLGSVSVVIDPVKEQEADRQAVTILREAGYDPHAMLDVAKRLPSGGRPSHLQDPRRIRSLEASLAAMPSIQTADSEPFQEAKRELEADLKSW
ncbi:MAG: M48 family metallopeptidase [Gammaproteobacteria bacterium]